MLTEEEKILRLQGLGGSDISVVFGLNPYRTPFELWEEKALGHIDREDNEDLAFRSYLEPAIGDMYRHRTGYKIWAHEGMHFHKDFPWLFANIDFMARDGVGGKRILEIKTSRMFKSDKFGEEGTDQIPFEYLLQVAHYCMCLNVECCDIAVLFGDFELKVYQYKRNRAIESKIVEKTRDFWFEHVVPSVPPEYTVRDDLNKLYNCASGKVAEATDELKIKIKALAELKEMKSKVDNGIKEIQNELKLYMKDAEFLTSDGNKVVRLTQYETTRIDTQALKNDKPKVYSKYCKTSVAKRFKLIRNKDE